MNVAPKGAERFYPLLRMSSIIAVVSIMIAVMSSIVFTTSINALLS